MSIRFQSFLIIILALGQFACGKSNEVTSSASITSAEAITGSCSSQNPLLLKNDSPNAVVVQQEDLPEGKYSYMNSEVYYSQDNKQSNMPIIGHFKSSLLGATPETVCSKVPLNIEGDAIPLRLLNPGPVRFEMKNGAINYSTLFNYSIQWKGNKVVATMEEVKDPSNLLIWNNKVIYKLDKTTYQIRYLMEYEDTDIKIVSAMAVTLKLE